MSRASLLRSLFPAAAVLVVAFIGAAPPAAAQSSACQEGQALFSKQASLNEQFGKLAKKDNKIDPQAACPVLSKMVANAEATVKWLDGNKDWCQVPEALVTNFTGSLPKMQTFRTQACQAAAKIETMQKQARQQAQQGGPGLVGGTSLTSEFKIPKGAL